MSWCLWAWSVHLQEDKKKSAGVLGKTPDWSQGHALFSICTEGAAGKLYFLKTVQNSEGEETICQEIRKKKPEGLEENQEILFQSLASRNQAAERGLFMGFISPSWVSYMHFMLHISFSSNPSKSNHFLHVTDEDNERHGKVKYPTWGHREQWWPMGLQPRPLGTGLVSQNPGYSMYMTRPSLYLKY